MLTFGSVFSGIGGIDLGLERAGMHCVWQIEIDPYRRRVLERHWPQVRRFQDVRDCFSINSKHRETQSAQLDSVSLICGGFPCQDLSIAGRRAGLSGSRSSLFFEFARIVGEIQPQWILIENVPGLLSSNRGRDFGIVLDTLGELRYGLAWRILDSRYFGVPQRRRRVYIVGHLGDLAAASVLFEPQGSSWYSATSQEVPKKIAQTVTAYSREDSPAYAIATDSKSTVTANYAFIKASGRSYVYPPANTNRVRETTGFSRWMDASTRYRDIGHFGLEITSRDRQAGPLVSGGSNNRPHVLIESPAPNGVEKPSDVAQPCCPDSPRYAALGDAVTVPVAEWIGRRILMAHLSIFNSEKS